MIAKYDSEMMDLSEPHVNSRREVDELVFLDSANNLLTSQDSLKVLQTMVAHIELPEQAVK